MRTLMLLGILGVGCARTVPPRRVLNGVKTTIELDQSLPDHRYDAEGCPHRAPLPAALAEYIEDYASANLKVCWDCKPGSQPQSSSTVDRQAYTLDVDYAGEGDVYCILVRGTRDGVVVTLKYWTGWAV